MKREMCPCCHYPTLDKRGSYDICRLCRWEDDGQDEPHAREVWGGPNSDYSLAEARENFKKYGEMYRESDNLLPQTETEIQLKKTLMDVYDEIAKSEPDSLLYKTLWERAKMHEESLLEIVRKRVHSIKS